MTPTCSRTCDIAFNTVQPKTRRLIHTSRTRHEEWLNTDIFTGPSFFHSVVQECGIRLRLQKQLVQSLGILLRTVVFSGPIRFDRYMCRSCLNYPVHFREYVRVKPKPVMPLSPNAACSTFDGLSIAMNQKLPGFHHRRRQTFASKSLRTDLMLQASVKA